MALFDSSDHLVLPKFLNLPKSVENLSFEGTEIKDSNIFTAFPKH